jgi:hypothetical protein
VAECAFYTVPQFASYVCSDDLSGEQPSEAEAVCDFPDGSYALYAMYNEMTAEFDMELTDHWSDHARDLMVLVRHIGTSFL